MSKPRTANPALAISEADLASALAQIGTEVDNQPLRSSALARIMRETFHGSNAGGAWDWRMAYDLMQAAAADGNAPVRAADPAAAVFNAAGIRGLGSAGRSDPQGRGRAGAIRRHRCTGCDVTGHDGEHIDELLQTPVLPDVVVMNPPFASSVDRSRDKHIAAKHLIAAAKRLAPGGRLVAIMPPGFTPERDAAHWSRACGLLTPRLALTMPGQVYRKLGTSVETQLMVFDKMQEDGEMIRAIVCDLDEALAYIDAVAATRSEMRPAQRVEAIPHARPTVASSAPRKTAAAPVAASKPRANAVRPPISDIYARYRPQRIEIAGAQEHPTPLVESIAMASGAPPMPSNTGSDDLRLPARLIEEGDLSEAQLETIIMAHDAHGRDLPGRFTIDDDQTKLTRADDDPDARAYRLGYFLGDGTGCGKGRECAGLILVNWLFGRAEAMSYESFTERTALRLIDKDSVLLEELPPIQRFLNRVLALPIHMQNALFAEFMRRIADQTKRARAALISARPMQMYDEDFVTLMRKAVRPNGSSYLEEMRFESSAWEDIGRPEFARLWDAEAVSMPKTTTTKLYLLTGLLLPIWKDIPTTNERIYRVTPDGATAMIGRTLSEEGAAALRARFLVSNPQTPQEMLTAALGTTAPVDLGQGLTLTRRRVAGEMRLELGGADRGMIEGLKAMGCFTEIIAFQLRVFLPHGDGIDTLGILSRIVGTGPDATRDVTSVAAE